MEYGQRLRAARKMAGLSQQNLAKRIPVTKQSISKYECGKAMPGSEVLVAISEALHVPVDFFLRDTALPALQEPSYRAHHTKLSKRDLDSIEQRVRAWLERYLELETIVPPACRRVFTHPFHHQGPGWDVDNAEKAAEDLRAEWDLGHTPIESMVEVLEDRGVKVMTVDSPDGFDGLAFWADDEIPVIVYSADVSGDRQRFSMAHELAHLLLEPKKDVKPEKLANRFAGAFIFPRSKVYAEIGHNRKTLAVRELDILKKKYGMSMQAIIYRAHDLNILSDHGKNKLFRMFSARGWRRQEPGAPVQQETPVRMDQVAAMALAEDALSHSRVAELLGRKPHDPLIAPEAKDDITASSG